MDAACMAAGLKQSGRNYSPWIAVFNMCNAAIGSGVLSFPYAFRSVTLDPFRSPIGCCLCKPLSPHSERETRRDTDRDTQRGQNAHTEPLDLVYFSGDASCKAFQKHRKPWNGCICDRTRAFASCAMMAISVLETLRSWSAAPWHNGTPWCTNRENLLHCKRSSTLRHQRQVLFDWSY